MNPLKISILLGVFLSVTVLGTVSYSPTVSEAAPNCTPTPPLNSMPWPYVQKYRASNPVDCWQPADGLCTKDACAMSADSQALQTIFQKAGELLQQLMSGGGGGGGGSSYGGTYDSGTNYTQEQAINDLYNNLGATQSDTPNLDGFFAPNEDAGQQDTDTDGDESDGEERKPGLSAQSYFGEAANTTNNSNGSDRDSNDNNEAGESDSDADEDDQPNTSDSDTNTQNSVSTSGTSGSNNSSGNTNRNNSQNTQPNNVEFLDKEGPDRIIRGGDDPYGVDVELPSRNTNREAGDGAQIPEGYNVEDYVYVTEDGQQYYFDWQAVEDDPALLKFLFDIGILEGRRSEPRLSGLAWFLVTPSHGLAVGISNGIAKILLSSE